MRLLHCTHILLSRLSGLTGRAKTLRHYNRCYATRGCGAWPQVRWWTMITSNIIPPEVVYFEIYKFIYIKIYILALDCTLIYLDDVSPTKSGVVNPVNFSSLLSKGKHVLGRAPGTGGIALVSLVGFPYWFLLKVLLSHPVHCLYCIMSRLTRRAWLLAYTGCENTRPPL